MDEIQLLDALTAIRKRPSMYVGDAGSPDATTAMLLEPLCFAINAPGGPAASLVVTIHTDGSATIANDGPGVPTEVDRRFKRPLLDVLMTELFACRALKSAEEEAKWCHCGVAITNALSRWCTVVVSRNGRRIERRYEMGQAVGEFRDMGACSESGTAVTFEPDRTIVTGAFDAESVARRLDEFAVAFPCLSVVLVDERRDVRTVLRRPASAPPL